MALGLGLGLVQHDRLWDWASAPSSDVKLEFLEGEGGRRAACRKAQGQCCGRTQIAVRPGEVTCRVEDIQSAKTVWTLRLAGTSEEVEPRDRAGSGGCSLASEYA